MEAKHFDNAIYNAIYNKEKKRILYNIIAGNKDFECFIINGKIDFDGVEFVANTNAQIALNGL